MKLSEVPESIWVITAEEIQNSGTVNVPELLRLVPGMNVSQLSNGNYNVTARDQYNPTISQLLVLVDSKPTNLSLHDYVPWPALPVVLEDIERI